MRAFFDRDNCETIHDHLSLLNKHVFYSWNIKPLFKVEVEDDDDDCCVLTLATTGDVEADHEAIELAQAFLLGVLIGKGEYSSV